MQGFIQFRLSGERAHLDVDTLNEQLRIYGADRMRHAMRPDEVCEPVAGGMSLPA